MKTCVTLVAAHTPTQFTCFDTKNNIKQKFIPGISVEEDICSIWAGIVNDWDAAQKRKTPPSVKELVRRGIPHYFRAIVWQLLCGASEADKKQYADYIKATSACEKVIRRDIARTYPEHDFFKEKDGLGQEALFNVMKAYSLHDREVGYCQGSGFIVGLLLMQVCIMITVPNLHGTSIN